MDWKAQTDQVSLTSKSLALGATCGQLSKGISVSFKDEPLMNAFAINDPDYQEQTELTFTRGRDLFATFEKQTRTAECYWRLPEQKDEPAYFSDESPGILLESIVSLRSSKLSTEPIQFSLYNENLVADSQPLGDKLIGIQSPERKVSWCLFAHPDDQNEVSFECSPQGIQIDIDVPLLERGVIRRIRLMLAIWAGESFQESLNAIYEEFAKSEIPLTT